MDLHGKSTASLETSQTGANLPSASCNRVHSPSSSASASSRDAELTLFPTARRPILAAILSRGPLHVWVPPPIGSPARTVSSCGENQPNPNESHSAAKTKEIHPQFPTLSEDLPVISNDKIPSNTDQYSSLSDHVTGKEATNGQQAADESSLMSSTSSAASDDVNLDAIPSPLAGSITHDTLSTVNEGNETGGESEDSHSLIIETVDEECSTASHSSIVNDASEKASAVLEESHSAASELVERGDEAIQIDEWETASSKLDGSTANMEIDGEIPPNSDNLNAKFTDSMEVDGGPETGVVESNASEDNLSRAKSLQGSILEITDPAGEFSDEESSGGTSVEELLSESPCQEFNESEAVTSDADRPQAEELVFSIDTDQPNAIKDKELRHASSDDSILDAVASDSPKLSQVMETGSSEEELKVNEPSDEPFTLDSSSQHVAAQEMQEESFKLKEANGLASQPTAPELKEVDIITEIKNLLAMSKSYVDLLVDQHFNTLRKTGDAKTRLMYCLRFRMSLQGISHFPSPSPYDALYFLLQGRSGEIGEQVSRLLIQWEYLVPVVEANKRPLLPLLKRMNEEHERAMAKEISEPLLRLVVVSCLPKEQSKTTHLLKEMVNLSNLHGTGLSKNLCSQPTIVEVGVGSLTARQYTGRDSPEKAEMPCLVLHVIGDVDPLCDLVADFADVLLVEVPLSEEQTGRCREFLRKCATTRVNQVIVWRWSDEALRWEWKADDCGKDDRRLHLLVQSAIDSSLVQLLSEEVMAHRKSIAAEVNKGGSKRKTELQINLSHCWCPIESSNRVVNTQIRKRNNSAACNSQYETLLNLLQEFDVAGRVEIFHLLLERRLCIPLFLHDQQHHLSILSLVNKEVDGASVCLGTDVSLMRVTIVSCRPKHQSQTTELLKAVFHVDTLHRLDRRGRSLTRQTTAADIGLGCTTASTSESEQSASSSVAHYMVVHVVGEFEPLWDFVVNFADYLIVEDRPDEASSFVDRQCVKETGQKLAHNRIVVWKSSNDELEEETVVVAQQHFSYLSIRSPADTPLYELLTEDVNEERESWKSTDRAGRLGLHEMDLMEHMGGPECSVSFVSDKVNQVGNIDSLRDTQFVLQKSFCQQTQYEEKKAQFRNEPNRVEEMNKEITKLVRYRQFISKGKKTRPLILLMEHILTRSEPSVRILGIRQLEISLSIRFAALLRNLTNEIDRLSRALTAVVQKDGQNVKKDDLQRQLQEAKAQYNAVVVNTEHIWREMSHLYAANQVEHKTYPQLAAQHLLDGMCIELLDGDSNMINLTWIKAILNELDRRLKRNKEPSRIFVLSVMGVQSSGKSTLLNIMFGTRLKTSVGQCTRGINMQLIPVVDRVEYDYILLLDTEGNRSPEYWGLPGSEKRDNQMATMSILLADATIIVNSGENDAAIKEILPIVLLAYQGSKLAEEKGGQMSSMVFFVYNRIDTQQKDMLSKTFRKLETSLLEAFDSVSKLVGTDVQSNRVGRNPFSLFRRFNVDTSNSKGSDVRILGNIKKSFTPPDDVPDPTYGEAVAEFWQHIHSRVTGSRQWKSRTLSDFQTYLDLVWNCLISADFTLRFKDVVERSAYDQMNRELKKCEQQLGEEYRAQFADIETEILKSKRKPSSEKKESVDEKKYCDQLARNLQPKINQLDVNVATILSDPSRKKWKLDAESSWNSFKKEQKNHWNGLLETFVNFQLKYDDYVEQYKIDMRKKIRQLFSSDEAVRMSRDEKDQKFSEMYGEVLEDAWNKHSSVNVSERVKDVYLKSPVIKILSFGVFVEDVEKEMEEIMKEIYNVADQNAKKNVIKNVISKISKFLEVYKAIHDQIMGWLWNKHCYADSVVDEAINITTLVTTSKRSLHHSELQKAHTFARLLVTRHMTKMHSEWEDKNSVYAKLNQQESRSEMKAYFDQASQGVVDTQLFTVMLRSNLEKILPDAFNEEVLLLTMDKVSSKNWLLDPKAMLNYMDLELINLIDRKEIQKVFDKIGKPKEFYEEVLIKLIDKERPDMEEEWTTFCRRLEETIKSAARAASQVASGRAKLFIHKLHELGLRSGFRNNFLAKKFTTDSEGYGGCENEEAEEFRQQLTDNLLEAVSGASVHSMELANSEFAQKVLNRLREERTEEGARPRCNVHCPLCKSLCILPFGHGSTKKHDTFHQPRGLTWWGWDEGHTDPEKVGTLCAQTCATADSRFLYNGEYHDHEKFSEVFPEWMQPTFTEHLPLREYIFATYHKEMAARCKAKPSVDIPASYYQHNLDNIRYDLQLKTNTLPPDEPQGREPLETSLTNSEAVQ